MINVVGTGKLKFPRRGSRKAVNLSYRGKHLLCAPPSPEEWPSKMSVASVVLQVARAGTACSSCADGRRGHQHRSQRFSCPCVRQDLSLGLGSRSIWQVWPLWFLA